MRTEDLQTRYGTHVSQRLRRELNTAELDSLSLDELPRWLEARADAAHETYISLLSAGQLSTTAPHMQLEAACQRWREAEDLAYLIVIAEDVCLNARAAE